MPQAIEVVVFAIFEKCCGKLFTCIKTCYNKVAEELILLGGTIRRGWR
jgi:hypothetical protein